MSKYAIVDIESPAIKGFDIGDNVIKSSFYFRKSRFKSSFDAAIQDIFDREKRSV